MACALPEFAFALTPDTAPALRTLEVDSKLSDPVAELLRAKDFVRLILALRTCFAPSKSPAPGPKTWTRMTMAAYEHPAGQCHGRVRARVRAPRRTVPLRSLYLLRVYFIPALYLKRHKAQLK